MTKTFLKNVLDVDVNGMTGEITYTIYAEHLEVDDEGYGSNVLEKIDKLFYTPRMMEHDGGLPQVLKDLKECYNLET